MNEPSPRNSTDAGRQIDCNEKPSQKVLASIRVSFDPDSNVNNESNLHGEKEPTRRNPTDAGRQIDFNDEQ
jgi:hypothetical protein